jgi:hypothetical protein
MLQIQSVQVHATGLRLPTHLGITRDGQLLVSEFAGQAVRDVSEEGDYGDCKRGLHASNLEHPGGILPLSDGRILVADSGSGDVHDITKSGPAKRSGRVFCDVPNPYGLVEFGGSVYLSFFDRGSLGLIEVDDGASFRTEDAFVRGFPCVTTTEPYPGIEAYGGSWPTERKGDLLLLGHSALGAIWDVTSGGTFDELRNSRFAWGLTSPGGMISDPSGEKIYVTERMTGVIREVAEPGYARFARPLLAGFKEPTCLRFTADASVLYVADKALGAIYRARLR